MREGFCGGNALSSMGKIRFLAQVCTSFVLIKNFCRISNNIEFLGTEIIRRSEFLKLISFVNFIEST